MPCPTAVDLRARRRERLPVSLKHDIRDTFHDLDVDDIVAIAHYLPRIIAWFRSLGHDPKRIDAAFDAAETKLELAEEHARDRIDERFPKTDAAPTEEKA